jgi:hypothetical protein
MNKHEHDRIRELLQQAFPPVGDTHDPPRDLDRLLHARINQAPAPVRRVIPWFDWALAGGLAIVAVAFPASIPVLLYYL